MSGDWLDTEEAPRALVVADPEKPADGDVPGLGGQALATGAQALEQRAQFIADWESLTDGQRVFLNTWRECRFNANRAMRVLANTAHGVSKSGITRWLDNPRFERVRELLRSASVSEILNRDYLAARQDDIVETLLTPKPILHQGVSTGHYEVEAGAASRANEVLLKLGGHLKDKDVEVNVGVVVGPPQLHIQVMPLPPSKARVDNSVVIDAKFTELPAQADDGWLDGP